MALPKGLSLAQVAKDMPPPPAVAADPSLELGAAGASASTGTGTSQEILGRRLDELLKEVDPHFQLEKDAEGLVLGMARDFIERVTKPAAMLAKHRKGKALELKDVQLVLEKHWGIDIPREGQIKRTYKVSAAGSTLSEPNQAHPLLLRLISQARRRAHLGARLRAAGERPAHDGTGRPRGEESQKAK